MNIWLETFILLLLILVNGLFSMSELALVSARRARLAVMSKKARRPAPPVPARSPTIRGGFCRRFRSGITLVSVLTGVFGGANVAARLREWLEVFPRIAPFADSLSLGCVVIVTTYLTLVLGELVPKQLALRQPETISALVARPLTGFIRVAGPVAWLLSESSRLVLRLFGLHRLPSRTVTEEELKALLVEGAQTGVLELEERDIIERVLRLADKPVRAIMTPRTELAWIDRTDPPKDIALALKAAPHSRIVVCEGSIDNVVGIVQAKDLLDRILSGGDLSIGAALRQPIVVPDTVTALDALERLKTDPLGLALVLDEYGSFEGLVTVADMLEAIVGDPADTAAQPAEPGCRGRNEPGHGRHDAGR